MGVNLETKKGTLGKSLWLLILTVENKVYWMGEVSKGKKSRGMVALKAIEKKAKIEIKGKNQKRRKGWVKDLKKIGLNPRK